MIYPSFPKAGDTIGVCAPSAGIGDRTESFDKSVGRLKRRGFRIRETAGVRNEGMRSADAKTRGDEFSELMRSQDVRAVIAATGGDFNIEMLPFADWDAIKKNVKWICGYSDPTFLTYITTTRFDIATMYGFNAGAFDSEELHSYQSNALNILSGNVVRQDSFDKYIAPGNWDDHTPSVPVKWQLENASSLDVTGRLIGGCAEVIERIIGTDYDYTDDFLNRYEDVIWYFDVFDSSAVRLYMFMTQMKYAGYLRGARAVLFGRVMFTDSSDDEYIELLKRVLDVPFVWNADIGHVRPSMTLINGSVARVTCDSGRGSIEMRLE